jgi:tetratricopeptide (TPR) repeat protein
MPPVDLEALWNWADPAASEKIFRALPPSAEVQTQIARAQGLQRRFDEAHRTLDAIRPDSPRVEVRCLLERGRTFNSSGKPEMAKPLFLAAWEKAQAAKLDFFAVDAAHMIAIVESPAEALQWNEKALALAVKSPDPKAQGWVGSLLNNIGWTYYDLGQYAKALDCFERDLKWFEDRKKDEQARIARYSIGKTLRALGRVPEALAQQRALQPDGYIWEEIAECLLALKRMGEAQKAFARAHELLSQDAWLAAREPQRIARLSQMAGASSAQP